MLVLDCHWDSWNSSLDVSGVASVMDSFVHSAMSECQRQAFVLSVEAEKKAVPAPELFSDGGAGSVRRERVEHCLTLFGGLGT